MLRAIINGLVGGKFAGARLTGVRFSPHGKGETVLSLSLAVKSSFKSGRILSNEQIREEQSLALRAIRDRLLAMGVQVKYIRGEADEIVLNEKMPDPKPIDVRFLRQPKRVSPESQESVSARLFKEEAREFD